MTINAPYELHFVRGCAREKEDIRKGCAPEGGGQVDMKERQGEWEERQKKRLSDGWGV